MAIAIAFGNVYYDSASFRLTGMTVNDKESKTLRWYYRKDGAADWIELTDEKQVIAAGNPAEIGAWCHIGRGKLSPSTTYNFRCVIDFSGSTATQRYYATQRTLKRIFSVNASGNVISKVKFKPVTSLGTAVLMYVFKAVDTSVRAWQTADIWEYVGSSPITSAYNSAGYVFNTKEDYKKYDYKILLVDKTSKVLDVIFIED